MQGPLIYKDVYLIVPRGGAYHIYSLTSQPIGHATSLQTAKDYIDGYSITAIAGDPPLTPNMVKGREILKAMRERRSLREKLEKKGGTL
jgi:hypothetical protein